MSNASQKRALRNYRDRLAGRGMARFEVLGLDVDRELIRSLARRLAEGDKDATRFARRSAGPSRASRRKRAAFSRPCDVHPWSARICR